MPRLIVNPGQQDERNLPVMPGSVTLGRGRENTIQIHNKSLSRQHARLEVADSGEATLVDVGSKNGTFIDGTRVDVPRPLVDGDQFFCGDVGFQYRISELSIGFPQTIVQEIPAEATRVLVGDLLTQNRDKAELRQRRALRRSAEGRLQVLLEVARLLSSPESIDKQLAKILDLTFSILDIDRAAILMIDPETGEFGKPVVESQRAGGRDTNEEKYSTHILHHVRDRSVAALFSDTASDPRLAGADSIHWQSVRSSMCAPLKPQDRIIGVLYVDNLTLPEAFTSDDLELLSAFAAQAAVALENSRLYAALQREAVTRSNLLRFFPPTTIAELMKSPDLTVDAIETDVTALFCDISGFTAMSARMHPRDVVALLNHYFPVMTEIVFRREGTLEKYIGDAVLAVWGAPFRRDDDALRAVESAVAMQQSMEELNAMLAREFGPDFKPLRIHIGLNSGPVAAGNIGSAQLLQYATIGDATNIASRICSLAGPNEIAIGIPTVQRLGDDPPYRLDGPSRHYVRGREEALPVYKVRWR
jgi:adenylate cyclase